MTSSAVRLATIITQSLAIAVAFTVLLGRIFVLSFYEDLGIPVSEAKLSAIDYSIFSPSVAVLGVGFAIIIGTLPISVEKEIKRLTEKRTILRWVLGFASIIVVLCIVSTSVLRSSKLGRDNATTTLQNAPQARVEFVSGNTLSTQHDFKVIMISDRFVYLLPEKEERPRESRVLHAFPVSSIARIDYISK